MNIIILDNIEYLLEHTPGPESPCGTFTKRLGEIILFVYNTVQITSEILLIVVVACNCSFWWKGNKLITTNDFLKCH